MVLITIVNGAYKPTYNWGAPHCIVFPMIVRFLFIKSHISRGHRQRLHLFVPRPSTLSGARPGRPSGNWGNSRPFRWEKDLKKQLDMLQL